MLPTTSSSIDLAALGALPHALDESYLPTLMARMAARPADAAERQAAASRRSAAQVRGSVAVVSVVGYLGYRADWGVDTPIADLTEAIKQVLADPQIGAVVLEFDSPGGQVDGIPECADVIRAGRGSKPILAVANTLCASAAYWLASACDEIIAAPSAMVGSIGVYGIHADMSRLYNEAGITVTIVRAGKFKAEGNRFEPLTPEAQAAMQEVVDSYYQLFLRAVATGRNTTPSTVRDGYGQGRALPAAAAVDAGLVDRVGTMAEVMTRLAGRRPAGAAAEETPPPLAIDAGALDVRRKRLALDSGSIAP